MTPPEIRPSALPKLKLCGHYAGDPVAGEAADRGTRMDAAFRWLRSPDRFKVSPKWECLTPEEQDAVMWASDTVELLAGGHPLLVDENACTLASIPHVPQGGTSDAVCLSGHWHADLKSGQVRDYEAQMAAYALGWMHVTGQAEWTAYLLFCDQRRVVTQRFTRESAEECILDALALVNGGVPPQVNEYCGWCVNRWSCPARREGLGLTTPLGPSLDLAAQDSETLARFAGWAAVVEDYNEEARRILKERMLTPGAPKVPGVSISSRQGSQKVKAEELLNVLADAGAREVFLAGLGDVSVSLASSAANAVGQAIPPDWIFQTPGSVSIRVKKPAELAIPKRGKPASKEEF